MGTVQTKFHELLVDGRVEDALLMWVQNEQLQARFDPNAMVSGRWRDPPLHCLLRHGDYKQTQLKVLALELLQKGADPLSVNKYKETALHIVCTSDRHSKRVSQARREMLELLMGELPDRCLNNSPGGREIGVSGDPPMWLKLADASQNTPLHLAAASGLIECVELLLACGAPLFAKNIAKQTPLDAAVKAKQSIIANFLESKMVFSESDTPEVDTSVTKSFYTPDQLKEMQSEVVKSLCSELKIPEYAARALLSSYGWSAELVIDAFHQNAATACQKAGIDPHQLQAELDRQRAAGPTNDQCGICYDSIDVRVDVPCGHQYCVDCWTQYLEAQVKECAGSDIRCPGHDCGIPVPMEVTARLLSKELYSKYSDLALHQFVDSKLDIKWCPYPDCGQAVLLKPNHKYTPVLGTQPGINTECGNGHGFCWNCMQHPHEPCECEVWEKWMKEIPRMAEAANIDLSTIAHQAEADAEWIVQNTKPCPQCKAPIQKNEGCNEMNCRKCRHNFCWVCLGQWREHGYRTGGYFQCNRYSAQRRANKQVEEARKNMTEEYRRSATETQKKLVEKFKFYYTRYENHLLSIKFECQLLQDSRARATSLLHVGRTLSRKVAIVRGEQTDTTSQESSDSAAKSVGLKNFLEDITRGLLRARRILATSYAIGYLIPDERKAEREAHETLQGKLEEVVEILAQMISRPHLNTPRSELTETALTVSHVCEEFLTVMREVVLAGLRKEPPPAQPPPPREEFMEVDPLVLFLHLAARNDPQFRDFWQQVLAEEAAERQLHQRQQRQN